MRFTVFALMMVLTGCATASVSVAPEPSVKPDVDRLSPVSLTSGECGLFVWTVNENKTFILFSQASKKTGRWFDGASEQTLSIISEDGAKASGQSATTQFEGLDGLDLVLSLGEAQTITDGTRFKTGLLKHRAAEGWEKITPVVGLATCQTE